MNPSEPPSRWRETFKGIRIFRPGKRAHTSASETLHGEQSAEPAELLPPVEVSNSDQSFPRTEHAVAGPSEPITTAPAQRGEAQSARTRDATTAPEIAWSAFKASLPILEKVSVVFPPLQSAVGGLMKVIAQFDTCMANVEKVEELVRTLDQLQSILSAYPEMMDSKQIQRLELIQRIFEEAKATIHTQKGKSHLTRFIEGSDDQSKLVDSMGKLTRFVNLLQLEILGQTGVSVKDMHRDIKYDDLLKRLEHIPSASFESTDSDIQTRVGCTPGTRTQILEMLTAWTLDRNGTLFFWLNGMAGTGKSTIAQSMCDQLDLDGMLAASFFCSRSAGGGRNDARKIVPTIAFQLAYHIPGFMQEICDVLRTPDRTIQPIEKQLKTLFWEPLDNASTASRSLSDSIPHIVVIDGLDECSDAGAQELVQYLLRRFENSFPIHLRFILFSRSEKHIGTPIRATTVDVSRFQLHDMDQSNVTRDIRIYVEAGLVRMSRKKEWGNEWYKQDDIDFIVLQADVLFIYASTVLKYLEASKFRPEKRLQILRQLEFTAKTEKSGPLRPLHLLYSIILENLGEADDLEGFEVDLVRNILFILSCAPTPLPIPTIADLIGFELSEVQECIGSLSSVVFIPPESEEETEPVKALHASFPEFVRSSSLLFPAHFRFDIGDYHRLFFIKCLGILNGGLREGLLGTQANRETDISDISSKTLSTFIAPGLRYATQHFLFHGMESDWKEPLSETTASAAVSTFANSHLLHWLECLAWIGGLDDMSQESLSRAIAHNLLLRVMPADFGHAFGDVLQLIKAKNYTFGNFPHEIYHTALVWLPKSISTILNRERTARSLPVVERGLPETLLSQSLSRQSKLVMGSLITVADSPLARWLSVADDKELIAHEWDTRVDSETQYSMGHLANEHVCSRMATNGVFVFDPVIKVLSFNHSIQGRLCSRELWHFKDARFMSTIELEVSVDGHYAAVWDQSHPRVWLVDVHQNTCHIIPRPSLLSSFLGSSSAKSFSSPFTGPFGSADSSLSPYDLDLCFSSDAMCFAISQSRGNWHEIRVFNTVDRTLQWEVDIFLPDYVGHHHKFFSPDSKTLVFLINKSEESLIWMQLQYDARTGRKTAEKSLDDVSPRVARFNWMREKYSDGAGPGIPFERFTFIKKSGDGIHKGKEEICRTPADLKWREQAQIGGTHLFLATANRGVIVLKLPPKVGEDAFSVEDGSSVT